MTSSTAETRRSASAPPERVRDELRLGSRIGLAVIRVLRSQPPFQTLIPSRQLIIGSQRVPEGDLLRPPPMTGPDHMQMRDPPLPRGVWLDEKPPPRPAAVQFRRHITPAIGGEPFPRLPGHGVGISHRRHQIDDRLGGKPGNRRGPDMLNPVHQPRRQQPGQPCTLGPCPVTQPGIMRTDLRLLIRPQRDSITHAATLARPPDHLTGQRCLPSALAPAQPKAVTSVTRRTEKSNTSHHVSHRVHHRTTTAKITTRTRPHTLSANTRHSYISHLIEDGADPLFVQFQAGHSWASTTATYTTIGQDARNRMIRSALALAYEGGDSTR